MFDPDDDDDPFDLHRRLADAVVSMLCAALSAAGPEDKAAHGADMLTTLELIAIAVLKHNFGPHQVGAALQALAVHHDDVAKAFVVAAADHGHGVDLEAPRQ